jgi:hypothetical protein
VVDLVVLLRAQPEDLVGRVLMHLLLKCQGSTVSELMCAKSEASMLAARHAGPTKGFGA